MPRLATLFVASLAACSGAPRPGAAPKQAPPRAAAELLYEKRPAVWFEASMTSAIISPNGQKAVYGARDAFEIVDLRTGRRDGSALGVDQASFAAFAADGEIVPLGSLGGDKGWFARAGGALRPIDIPPDADPRWSPSGDGVAYTLRNAPEKGLFVGAAGGARPHPLGGRVTGFAWLPDGSALLAMVLQRDDPRGGTSLMRLEAAGGRVDTLARDLDTTGYTSRVAVAPDGLRAYVALASAHAPVPEERHRPNADRDLDIYEIDLTTFARRPVVATPAEEGAPFVANGHLYWTATVDEGSVVVVPVGGGGARTVVRDAELPSWRPDGRAMGFTYGGWRHADWALNLDGGVVEVDPLANAAGRPRAIITGYHEDFSPVWSPDGSWLAYHTHRPPTPVSSYGAPGAVDDIFLRRPGEPTEREVRLTDFGWEAGSPDWSPDGRRLLFTGWVKGGEAGHSLPWVVTIDPATGRALASGRLPLPPSIRGAEMAAWSPGGDEVAIEERRSRDTHALWVSRADGSSARLIVEYPMTTYGGVDWAPDGRTLVYSALSGDRMQLFAVPAAGGEPRRLTDDAENLLHPQVSPDGRLVAASRISHRKQIWRMRL